MAEEPSYPTNVVVFKSDSPRTIKPKFTQSGVTLQYSIDNGSTWNNISSGATTASSDEIWFRGRATSSKSLYASYSSSGAWVFSGDSSNKLHVYGDLRYLLCNNLGDNTITFSIASYCFSKMFEGCTSLTTAPSLPATTLAYQCYYGMFSGCTGLTTAPSLPATTLADSCYYDMFYGCTSLTTAPSLPATTLKPYCYCGMFYGCTKLTTAPSLPATTLKTYCYHTMFRGCTSLTTAPSLPATTLVDYCYRDMFMGCTKLTTVPSLPATTLPASCYWQMFRGCTALKISTTQTESYRYAWRIPTSGTGTVTGTTWNYDMLVNTGGTFTGRPTINTTYYVENPPIGPKAFEVDDILPATTQLKISAKIKDDSYIGTTDWYLDIDFSWHGDEDDTGDFYIAVDGVVIDEYEYYGHFEDYIIIDTSEWTVEQRTVKYVSLDLGPGDYITWEDLAPAPPGYTITFNSNGGTTISDIEEATELPSTLPTTTKSGYTFVNWYYDSAFTQIANAGDTIEGNVTLYAKWHNLGSLFTEIANAIRSKDGTSENIRDVDFGERVKQIQGAKEEQTKTVSPTTSIQDVLPDANKVLSKVTVNAIPTETKSQQPNLSSGDQTINATSGKFMTSFTITKDTVNHIASNIRSGITLYGVTGSLQPAKEEETKTVTPNFSSGSVDVTPTTGKVLSQVTINKDGNLVASNIKKDITVHGITGTSYIAIELTQAQYDALETKDANTYYLIVEVE